MTGHFTFRPQFTGTVIAALVATQVLPAQEIPPPPPTPVLLTQAPEPTPVAPLLPGFGNSQLPLGDADLPPADPNLAVPDTDVEAYARGPVHEAFADVYELDPTPNELVPTAPPAPVDELPPEQVPTGDNVQWISGYWAWDLEAKDFLWVSGVWRDVPPGRRWVPGYWAEVTNGYQWVSGFWADAQVAELTYLPPPPASLEVGPNVPPPSDDQIWVPGSWNYVNSSYSWSPGYYMVSQPNTMWVPNQYVWTPRGCVFVPGYMDYRFANRGVCFSPVRFRRPLLGYGYGRAAWYRPRYSISMSGFLIHLFVRPRSRSFYYGDYYGNTYAGFGYSPWYRRTAINHRIYDPAFNFYRWDAHRHGQNFVNNVDTWHRRYESNVNLRPPHLVHDNQAFLARHQGDRAAQLAVTTQKFDDAIAHRGDLNFRRVDAKDLNLVRDTHRANHDLQVARQQVEHSARPGNIVNLKPNVGGDRGNIPGASNHGRGEKLKLNDLPASLKDRTQQSVARAETLRQQAHVSNHAPSSDPTAIRSRVEALREQRAAEHGNKAGLPAGVSDKVNRGATAGGSADHSVHPNVDALRQKIDARQAAREASSNAAPKGNSEAAKDSGNGNSRLEALRQRAETHRNAGPAAGATSGVPRSLDTKPGNANAPRVHEASAAQIRAQEIRQQAEVRKQDRVIQREAPVQHQPRVQQNPAPTPHVPRHVEQAPRSAPVQHAPRQVDRAPVQHAPRAPAQHHAPSHAPSHGRRKG